MPATAKEHWDYTLNEWRGPFHKLLTQIDNPKIIFDLGANVGGFSEVCLEKWPKAKVHAFEPVERNYKALEENMGELVSIHKYGIYYGATSSHVVSRGDGNIGAFFVEQINAGEPRVIDAEIIELRTLEELGIKPDLIKFDIEGAEENVLEHSELCWSTPWLLIEWHPPTPPLQFFASYLPNHRVVDSIDNIQFLLCLK